MNRHYAAKNGLLISFYNETGIMPRYESSIEKRDKNIATGFRFGCDESDFSMFTLEDISSFNSRCGVDVIIEVITEQYLQKKFLN